MFDINKYLEKLKKVADSKIESEKLKISFTNDFEKVNYFLIDKAISENLNLFIKNTEFQDYNLFYEPIIKSVALSLFLKNYAEDKTTYEIGDVLIDKDGKTFELIEKTQGKFKLKEKSNVRSKHGDITHPNKNIGFLKECILLKKNVSSDRKLKNLESYRTFFKENFNLSSNYVPSKFLHKAVIISDKKDILENLKQKDVLKKIPIQWVTKDGTFETTSLPLDPMIYLVPDYETFREYILEKDNKIETIIIIGENKYSDCFHNITRAIREKNIKNVILIGTEETEKIKENLNFLKWRWTYAEYAKLNKFSLPTINTIKIQDDDFSKAIKNYTDYLTPRQKKLDKENMLKSK